MKRIVRQLLLVVLCLCLAVPAFADTGAVLIKNDLKDARWIYNTNLLRVPGSDGYSINTVDGTALTGALYVNLEGTKGYIVAAQVNADPVNAFGVFDVTGKNVVPFQYGDVRMESSEWALGIVLGSATSDNYDYKNGNGDTFYLIQTVDVYHLPEGKLLATLNRDQFLDAEAVNHCLNIQDRASGVISCYDAEFNQVGTDLKDLTSDTYAPADYEYYAENGQRGIKDADGNVIMPPSFRSIDGYKRGYFLVSTGDKVGLADQNGNVVVAAEYDRIKSNSYMPLDSEGSYSAYVAFGYACVVLDGKMGYVDLNGNVTCTPTYAEKSFENNFGISATLVDLEGKTHIVSADGVDTVVEGYANIAHLEYTAGIYYKVYDGSCYGMIDWHGNEILPCQYASVATSSDGQYALVSVDYDHYEIYRLSYPAGGEASAAPVEETPAEVPQEAVDGADEPEPADEVVDEPALADEAVEEPVPVDEGTEAPVDDSTEAPAIENEGVEAASANNAAVKSLLDSSVSLLNADAAANRDAVVGLLNSAITLLGTDNDAVVGLLNSAITLLNADAEANAVSIISILGSASGML